MQHFTPIGLYLQLPHNVDFFAGTYSHCTSLFAYTAMSMVVRGGRLGGAKNDSPNKACGTDDISARFVIERTEKVVTTRTKIHQSSVASSIVPEKWKQANKNFLP